MKRNAPTGMTAFTLVWLGQLLSLMGSSMTHFALTIWAWQATGQATALALVGFFTFAPTVLLSPVAGALVDRLDRKLVMMLSDLASGLATVVMLGLYLSGSLEIWHLYVLGAWSGAFNAFQFPAYSAAISTMLPKMQYARANGMLSLADSAAHIAAPILAGVLLALVGIGGIFIIDIVTFCFALLTLLLVHVPRPKVTDEGRKSRSNLWRESLYGFSYILKRPGLLSLQLVFTAVNLSATFGTVVLAPMILARTANNELVLASVQSAAGLGGLAGGLLLSLWGGPKRRIHGVLLGMAASGLLGASLLGLGQDLPVWLIGAFFAMFFIPILNGSNQAIWQAKVSPDIQGKVFATRRLIAQVTAPVAMLLAGPLADRVLEPAMMSGGALAESFGRVVGTGPGAGMALMLLFSGLASVLIGLGGYLFPIIRNVETLLPDHDASPEPLPTQDETGEAMAVTGTAP
jgi:DHA3 family macrolide efflux protein-like MFS transporter